MRRRSQRLLKKNRMSRNAQDTQIASTDESDDEKTILESNEPTIAELRNEIFDLKKTIKDLLDIVKSGPSDVTPTESKLPVMETMPKSSSSAIEPAAKYGELFMPDKYNLPTPMPVQHSTTKTSEYHLPYNMPNSAPLPKTSLPFSTANTFAPVTTSLNYNFPPPSIPTTTLSYNFENTITPLDTLSTTPGFSRQRFTQIYTSAQPRMAPVASTHPPESSASAFSNIHQVETTSGCRQLRKLLDLPLFNGQPEQWPMFIVAYNETTKTYNYSNLENLIRLQKSLKGDAKARVEAFLIHPDSVNQVVGTLEFHYGRPQILIRSQIAKVRAFPPINEKRIHEIVNFSTVVLNVSTFLTNANAAAHLCNPTLLDEMVCKLPLHKREEWSRHSVNHLGPYPSVTDFSLWLQEIATYISISLEADTNRSDAAYNKRDKINPSFMITTNENKLTKCVMCQQNHLLYHCDKFRKVSVKDRWSFIKGKHLCFSCFRAGHSSLKCKNRRQCGLSGCMRYHNRLLHEDVKQNQAKNNSCNSNTVGVSSNMLRTNIGENCDELVDDEINLNSMKNNPVNTIVESLFDKETLFKYLPVELIGPRGMMKIIAFIDEGSKITLLEDEVADEIGLQGISSNLRLGWIGGKTTTESSKKVSLEISAIGGNNNCFQMRNVWTTKNLKLPPQNLRIENFKERFPVLNDFAIEDYFGARPKLLIGLPHIWLVRPSKVLNLDNSFAVHETCLGNILFGSNEDSLEATVCKIDASILEDIHKQVLDYFTLESLGVKILEPVVSQDDIRAEKILLSTTVKNGNQYETGLLWRRDGFEYKDSYTMALKRLCNMEARMKRDKEFADWYTSKIDDYVLKSYARKLLPQEAAVITNRTWYLPHFVVTNLNKDNKKRLVFDAAACVGGESFNSRLMKGPNKYQPISLLSTLFRFRQRKVGVCADIREMFHRVRIRDQDQTAQRFLWRNGDSDRLPDEYVMQVMIFGSVSSPCSAQYVKNLNAQLYRDTHPEAYRAIVNSHYVDDYVDCFDDIADAVTVTKNVVNIHRQAGFELRGFVSNDQEFLAAINTYNFENESEGLANLVNADGIEKILGMRWGPRDDSFCYVLKFSRVPVAVLRGNRKPTKSEVLSLSMSIFDPLGFLANVVIKSKIILQELWRGKIDWDVAIPDEIYAKWYAWYKSLYDIKHIKIKRCYAEYFSAPETEIELHIFTDASEVAFAAVAYWRICHYDELNVVFVAGKSRCAPLKQLSIPRLELQAAVLGLRLKESIVTSHDIKPGEIIFWSDSKTVIKWIQSDGRTYKQFVGHRIAEILESSDEKSWRWLPGSLNPADDATRSQDFSNTFSTSRWLNGPSFLRDKTENWPKIPDDINDHEVQAEKRSAFIFAINNDLFIPFERYSNFLRLLRIMSWVRRAVQIFRSYAREGYNMKIVNRPHLSVQEIDETTRYLCKAAQKDAFPEEYNKLKIGKPISKSSQIFKLTPFLCKDGLIRLSGRIYNATCVARCTKEPIILPKQHILTRLIVKQYHEQFGHQNQESVCAAIRIKYWIPCLRQIVRSVKRNCQICKNTQAVPKPPLMGQHPEDRVTPYVRPFSYTGMDYMGPFFISVGRRHEKRWVALFTCLSTRAIHLEISKDLSTDAAILSIRNFINRRGLPIRIRCDRGTNFVGASKVDFIFDETKLADECSKRGIQWSFNTPANPSAGGAWERMVRSVKSVMAFTLKEKAPQMETFQSLLIEAENLINSRPLTHLPIESVESEPLTPNHFLMGCPNLLQTPAVTEKICLKKQWQILQQLKQSFWKRWVLEYLPELTRRTKWHSPVKPIKTGDVVIICDDGETRGQWKRGLVEEVFAAADGQVRSAVVKTAIGRLKRPASKLAVLDVSGEPPRSAHGGRDVMN